MERVSPEINRDSTNEMKDQWFLTTFVDLTTRPWNEIVPVENGV